MNHNRYLRSNKPVCERPDLLGEDFVVLDYGPGEPMCKECYTLLFTHNEREYQRELAMGPVQASSKTKFGAAIITLLALITTCILFILWVVFLR
jgi:hypothetical protein